MPAPLTDEWIKEQLKLCNEATRGPWYASTRPWVGMIEDGNHYFVAQDMLPRNAAFIAAAREGYPLVLEWVQELRAEMDAICYAAHMPDDYEFGLPSWINQHLYGELIALRDADGGPISRSEDIDEIRRLRALLGKEAADAS